MLILAIPAQEIRETLERQEELREDLEKAARDELAHVARVATMGELAAAFGQPIPFFARVDQKSELTLSSLLMRRIASPIGAATETT